MEHAPATCWARVTAWAPTMCLVMVAAAVGLATEKAVEVPAPEAGALTKVMVSAWTVLLTLEVGVGVQETVEVLSYLELGLGVVWWVAWMSMHANVSAEVLSSLEEAVRVLEKVEGPQ